MKPNKYRTHDSKFLLYKEPGAVSVYVANCNNKSEADYLAALVYTERRGMQNICAGILCSVTNCWVEATSLPTCSSYVTLHTSYPQSS